ncbi:hypothetical protein ACFFGH_10725 [Lysobacter korlensis]|uniref:Transmembrane protein n=1 Tax=Lysobacter korlensis TaxID=553636 RepID=A0ABV6RMV3_9GAMM
MSRATRITLLATAAAVVLGFGSMIVFGFNAASLAVLVVAGPILLVAVAVAAAQWGMSRERLPKLFTALGWCSVITGVVSVILGVVRIPFSSYVVDVVFALVGGLCGIGMGVTWLRIAWKMPVRKTALGGRARRRHRRSERTRVWLAARRD